MNSLEVIGLVFLARVGQKMCFSPKRFFQKDFECSLQILAIQIFWGFLVLASLYKTVKYRCAEKTGQVLKIWLRSSVFLWELAFFCLRGTILSFFRPIWGNI